MKSRPAKPPSGKLLFDTPERPANIFVANVDGASRGNPGPASYAVILRGPDGVTRFEVGKYIGRTTNNVAEYYALITALDYAAAQGIDRLLVRSDSELLVRQMQGRYKVNSQDLRPLHERARKLAHGFAYFAIEHVPREQNREADELANSALDRTGPRSGNVAGPGGKPNAQRGAKAFASRGATQIPGSERPIRARYSAGALHPLEGLELSEDEIVEISIRRLRNPS
jgi:probable phosphoglycerate mutase